MVYYGVSVYHSGWLGDVLELFGSKMLETAVQSRMAVFFWLSLNSPGFCIDDIDICLSWSKCEPKVEVQEETVSARAGGNWAVFHLSSRSSWHSHLYKKCLMKHNCTVFQTCVKRMFFSASFGPWPSVRIARSESGLAARGARDKAAHFSAWWNSEGTRAKISLIDSFGSG